MGKKSLILVLIAIGISGAIVFGALLLINEDYRDDISSKELCEFVSEDFGRMIVSDDDVILEFNEMTADYLNDYTVAKSFEAKNINEIGIFHSKGEYLGYVKDIVENYVEEKKMLYRAMDYFPEEITKIDCADVVCYGNYVIYYFLNETDAMTLNNQLKNKLTQ